MSIISSISSKTSTLSPEATVSDQAYETKDLRLRPKSFETYIGQSKLQELLKISISAALKRNDPSSMGHILLYGPPGLGKTSCAYLLADALGSSATILSAPALDRPKDILGILMSLNEGDILFIDEIHRLNKVTEELLYPALEDYEVDLNSGKGNSSRVMRLKINKFILVGATTKLGVISAPLRDRFTHIHRMEYYKTDELSQIISNSARILDISISAEAAKQIAKRSRGTPRIANRLLRLVRDYASHIDSTTIDNETASSALDLYCVDPFGLDLMDIRILTALVDKYAGGPAGLESIASLIGEDKYTIEDYNEPFLIQSGFLLRSQRGRIITDEGRNYLLEYNKCRKKE